MNTALRSTASAAASAAGNGLDATIKYLQRTTSGAAGNDRAQRSSTCDAQRAAPQASVLGSSSRAPPQALACAPRPSTCAAPQASVLAPQSSTCDAQREAPLVTAFAPRSSTCAAPQASAWAPRSSTCDAQRAPPRETTSGRNDEVPPTHNERRREPWPKHHDHPPL